MVGGAVTVAQGIGVVGCTAQEGVAVPLESPAVHCSSTSSKFSLWPVQSVPGVSSGLCSWTGNKIQSPGRRVAHSFISPLMNIIEQQKLIN